jgi:hypothetical protein
MFRIEPQLPAGAFKTYAIRRRRDVLVAAACEQVACPAYLHGWESTIDERTDLGRQQAAYIRTQSRRTFRELRTEAGLTVFRFDAHQRCFADHHTTPETYLVRGGDHRTPRAPARVHTRPADWVEDCGEHLQRVADDRERG